MKLSSLSIAVLLATVAVAMDAQACKCAAPSNHDAIFEGRVVRMSKVSGQAAPSSEVEFSVSRTFTGVVTQRATIYTPVPVLLCGVPFQTGQRYLVRAVLVGGRLETLDCYGTKKL